MKRYIKSAITPLSDEDYSTKLFLVRDNRTRNAQLLEIIEDTNEPYLLEEIIKYHSSSPDIVFAALKKIPDDVRELNSHFSVMSGMAKTTRSPEVIRYLRDDNLWENSGIRYNLALNPATPVDILEELAEDEDSAVRHEVARNPDLPMESLQKLLDDPSFLTRNLAQKYYKLRGGKV